MRSVPLCLCFLFADSLLLPGVSAQNKFEVTLSSSLSVPPSSSNLNGDASFTLYSDFRFAGIATIDYAVGDETTQLFRSTSSDTLGTALFSMKPEAPFLPPPGGTGPYGYVYSIDVQLTPLQVEDLVNGNIWLNVGNDQFAISAARGQIFAVPEASTLALLALGFGLIGISSRKHGKNE